MAIVGHHPEIQWFAALRRTRMGRFGGQAPNVASSDEQQPADERPGKATFILLLVCVLLAVVTATVVTVDDSSRSPLMARSDILYPVGK